MAKQDGVMFIIDTLLPGGAEHVLLTLTQNLRQQKTSRYKPIIASLYQSGPLAQDFKQAGVSIYSEILANRYDVKGLARLLKIIRDENIKIIVAVGSGGNRMFWSTIAAKLSSVKVVVWAHTYSQPSHLEFETYNRVIYPLVDQFVALGTRHAACLAWRDKVPEGRITIIPNGIKLSNHDAPQWRDRARAILGIADESICAIGLIANLRPSKRHDIFIEAAKKVVQQNRKVHFFIIGDGSEQSKVQNLANQSKLLGAHLSLLGHRNDVPVLLPGLDLVCLCSEWQECLSLTALQAAGSRVPVVSNFIGSMDEFIINNQTGFFYKTLNANSLAQRISELAKNEKLRKQIAYNAYVHVETNFTNERLCKDFINLFDKLLKPTTTRTGVLGMLSKNLSSKS
jgi:glycosyltransferase involved in cell wall biosynthesis